MSSGPTRRSCKPQFHQQQQQFQQPCLGDGLGYLFDHMTCRVPKQTLAKKPALIANAMKMASTITNHSKKSLSQSSLTSSTVGPKSSSTERSDILKPEGNEVKFKAVSMTSTNTPTMNKIVSGQSDLCTTFTSNLPFIYLELGYDYYMLSGVVLSTYSQQSLECSRQVDNNKDL